MLRNFRRAVLRRSTQLTLCALAVLGAVLSMTGTASATDPPVVPDLGIDVTEIFTAFQTRVGTVMLPFILFVCGLAAVAFVISKIRSAKG